jgi:hypothetical protein
MRRLLQTLARSLVATYVVRLFLPDIWLVTLARGVGRTAGRGGAHYSGGFRG